MKLRNAVAGAAVLVLLVILAVLLRPEQADGRGGGERAVGAAGPGPAPPVSNDLEAAPASRESLLGSGARPARSDFFGWHGVVSDADGVPLAGARVLAVSGSRRVVAQAAADGSFELQWPIQIAWSYGSVWAESAGMAAIAVNQPPSRPPAELALQLRTGIPVQFTVLDKRSELPVAGVPVGIEGDGWISSGTTGADGSTVLQAAKPGPCYGVIHPTTRVAGDQVVQRFIEPGSAGLSIVMRVAVFPEHVSLLARDRSSGLVLETAEFHRVLLEDDSWSVGERLPGVGGVLDVQVSPEDRPLIVRVEAEGYLPREVQPLESSDGVVMVDLERSRGVPVQVLRKGRPTGPATLHWSMPTPLLVWPAAPRPEGPPLPWRENARAHTQLEGTTQTAADGRAELPFLGTPDAAPGLFALRIVGPEGLQRDFGMLQRKALGDPRGGWSFELDPPRAVVVVTVLDALGEVRAGVPVRLLVNATESVDPVFTARALTSSELEARTGTGGSTETNAQGEASFELLAGGTLHWTVGSGVSALRGAEAEPLQAGEERRIQVVAAVGEYSIAGQVVEADAGPLRGDWMEVVARPVLLQRETVPGTAQLAPRVRRHRARVDENGEFRITGMQAGLYFVHVESVVELSATIEVAAGVEDLRIPLFASRNLQVMVIDAATGAGIAGAEVSLHGSLTTWSSETGTDGGAVFDGFSPEFTQVLASAPGFSAWGRELAGMSDEELLRLRAELQPGRQVRLELELAEDARPVARVVRGDLPREDPRQRAVRFVRGTAVCTLRSAPRSDFTLLALDADGAPVGKPLRIPPGNQPVERSWSLR